MRQSGLMLTVTLVAVASCSDSLGPARGQVAKNLVGTWAQQPSRDPENRLLTIEVRDTLVSGTGSWSNGTTTGKLTLTGYIADSAVVLSFAENNGERVTYSAQLVANGSLTGTIAENGSPVSVEFDRINVDPH